MAPMHYSLRQRKMATDTTYTLSMEDAAVSKPSSKTKGRRHHRRGSSSSKVHSEDDDPSDGSASLTYSAGSSIASRDSAAGESTDSSFADIMRVLDMQDSQELAAFMKREGVTDPSKLLAVGSHGKKSTVSVASSLNYSTDGESALEGAHLLQTITGQPSDSYGPDGGGFGDAFGEMMFAPADQVPEKKKRSSRKERAATTKEASSPKSLRVKSSSRHSSRSDSSPNRGDEQPSTPPPVPRSRRSTDTEDEDDEEVWYAKWWMCGFADSFRDLVPKR